MARSSRPAIAASVVATGRGDDGSTGLLFGGPRVAKDDLRVEAYGTLDEAIAALGLARAELGVRSAAGDLPGPLLGLADLILRLQRELFVVGAELATTPEHRERGTDGVSRVSEEMLDGLEALLAEHEAAVTMPREFVVPGETRISAALEVARTALRRAERRAVSLATEDGLAPTSDVVPYLNRLADLLWVLAREAEQGEAHAAVPSRPGRRPRTSG
ncbi:MAG TPA: cob(I)yrinic acid a,c-diamide adenosyltransferase [Candidatus Limnocylindrales bacterium]|nr:cob(I)yrinic acid a,c-diamide adenosyltransferase [Candidatus Limnocylindrales bacterium]